MQTNDSVAAKRNSNSHAFHVVTMAAARIVRDALCLTVFCKVVLIYLFFVSLFAKNCLAYTSYSRQELLDIGSCNSVNFTDFTDAFGLISEIARTAEPTDKRNRSTNGQRRRHRCKQRGSSGGLNARLKLAPHRPSLPSIFLANVRSLPNKMDELRLRITTNKWIMYSNIMIFTETWLNSNVPDSAIDLAERYTLRADRTKESGKSGEMLMVP